MWELHEPQPVKLIIGILAANENALRSAQEALNEPFGPFDLESPIWPFSHTQYYRNEMGDNILRRFVTAEKLIHPGRLAEIKHAANALERELAEKLKSSLPRPVNLDPGYLEPSKLVLASTKNFAHRIYIGQNMFAEVTLTYSKGTWNSYPFTFPDYKSGEYDVFLTQARDKLAAQLKALS